MCVVHFFIFPVMQKENYANTWQFPMGEIIIGCTRVEVPQGI